MKRLVTVLVVLAVLAAASATVFAADAEMGKTIGFVNAGPDDYYAQFGKTLVAVAKSYGMNVVEVNSNYKPEKELANVQDLIAKGVDAIAVITAGAAGSAKSVEAANHAHVPIFFIAGKPGRARGRGVPGPRDGQLRHHGVQDRPVGGEALPECQDRGNPGLPGPGSRGRGNGGMAARSR